MMVSYASNPLALSKALAPLWQLAIVWTKDVSLTDPHMTVSSWNESCMNHSLIHKNAIFTINTGILDTVSWCASAVYPKKYAHGSCFAVLCCGYVLTDLPISIRITSLALWQSNDCHSASKATLVNMGKCIMWIHYGWLHNHNKAKHNKTVCKFLGIYCM